MEIIPRPFGEILSQGVVLLGRVWRPILAPVFWAFVALGALTIGAFVLTGADDFLLLILNDPQALEALTDEELFDIAVRLAQAASIAVSLQILATGFVNLTVHRVVASEIAGAPVTSRQATARALGRLLALVGAMILVFVFVLLGLVALIIPGIWLAGSFSVIAPVVALEQLGPIAALRRSMDLVKGRWWPTVGFLLLVGLLGSAAAQLVQLIALPSLMTGDVGLGGGLAFVVLMVVQGLVVAAIAVMTTLWYLDLRARKETLLTSSLT